MMRQIRMIQVAVAALFSLLALSCTTVKEDRGACPCYLTIDVDAYAAMDDYPSAMVQVQGGSSITSYITPREYESRGLEMKVERRPNRVTVLGGIRNSSIVGDTLKVNGGAEADPLMVFNEIVDCNQELAFVKAVPHKKWCEVNIVLIGEESLDDYPYDIGLAADCNSMRISSGLPVRGNYKVLVERRIAGNPVIRVPCQKENALRLDFYEKNEKRIYSPADRVFYLDLGREMESRGYDWTKDNLDDVFVYVDHASMNAKINIVEWDITKLNVEI